MTSRRRLPGRQLRAELPNHRVWSAGRRISLATLAARSPGIPGLLSTCRTAPAAPTSPMPSRRTVPAEPPAAGFAHPAGRPLRLHRPLEDERDGICPIFKKTNKKTTKCSEKSAPVGGDLPACSWPFSAVKATHAACACISTHQQNRRTATRSAARTATRLQSRDTKSWCPVPESLDHTPAALAALAARRSGLAVPPPPPPDDGKERECSR